MSGFLKIYVISSLFTAVLGGLKDREFILEKFDQCTPKLPSYVITLNVTKSFMVNNHLTIVGSADISQALGNDMAMRWRFRKCQMTNNDCSKEYDFPIPSFCLIVGTKTPFGNTLGEYFSPILKCPMKKARHQMNVTISLQSVIDIPSSRIRYRVKLYFLDSRKKKDVGCVELVTYVKHLT